MPPRTGRFVMFANLPKLPVDPGGTVSPLASGNGEELELPVHAAPQVRGSDDLLAELFVSLRAHVSTGGRAAIVVAGAGTASRVVERLGEAEVPAKMLDAGATPAPWTGRGAPRITARRTGTRRRRLDALGW